MDGEDADPQVAPQGDEPDKDDLGTTEGTGQGGYPEEGPRETVPDGEDPDEQADR